MLLTLLRYISRYLCRFALTEDINILLYYTSILYTTFACRLYYTTFACRLYYKHIPVDSAAVTNMSPKSNSYKNNHTHHPMLHPEGKAQAEPQQTWIRRDEPFSAADCCRLNVTTTGSQRHKYLTDVQCPRCWTCHGSLGIHQCHSKPPCVDECM